MAYKMCLLLLIFLCLVADVVPARAAKFSEGDGPDIHVVAHHHHRPKFAPGAWKHAHATFYEGGSGTFGMNI